jgi:hypothetical protein
MINLRLLECRVLPQELGELGHKAQLHVLETHTLFHRRKKTMAHAKLLPDVGHFHWLFRIHISIFAFKLFPAARQQVALADNEGYFNRRRECPTDVLTPGG